MRVQSIAIAQERSAILRGTLGTTFQKPSLYIYLRSVIQTIAKYTYTSLVDEKLA